MNAAIDVTQVLREKFGFGQFRPGQREVIEHLLAGRSAAAVFPTGAGKSLCYQLPALLFEGVTLVVSPLIALMKDQIDVLAARGIPAARLDSSLGSDEYRHVIQQIKSGALRLLYVAPERFQNEGFRDLLGQLRVSLFAVDEAHCISEWGHNFRPDYLKLVESSRQCRAERLLALTATATPKVLGDIEKAFHIEPGCAIRNSAYRPNLTLLTSAMDSSTRDQQLLQRLKERPAGPTIVYVTLQRTAEDVAANLAELGWPARPYHAGMKPEERSSVQEWFMASDAGIVVATIAFGMGIDKANIRYVYHYNLPKSLESYSQEIGRAGRDGNPAICETFVCLQDRMQLENFALGDTPTLAAVEKLTREIFQQPVHFDVSYYELSSLTDIRLLVVRTLLTYLELDGYLVGGTPYFAGYRFQAVRPSQEILQEFSGERREFIASLFRQVRKAKTWLYLDVDAATKALGAPRERIVRALEYLSERGWLKLETSGVRNRYQRLKEPDDAAALAKDLHRRMVQREQSELARIQQFIDLANSSSCQVNALCAHFGETRSAPCGHCSVCLRTGERTAAANDGHHSDVPKSPPIDPGILSRAASVRRENAKVLSDPVLFARFLAGITTPALSKARLTKHALFGSLGNHGYKELLRTVTG